MSLALPAAMAAPQTKEQSAKPKQRPAAAVPAPRNDAGWKKRQESISARVKQGNVDLIFIGDSITHGWEGGGKKVWDEFYASATPSTWASAATRPSTSSGDSRTATSTASPPSSPS
jgi:hypothetical protein